MKDAILYCQLCDNKICNVIDSNLDENDEVLLICPDCFEKIVYGEKGERWPKPNVLK